MAATDATKFLNKTEYTESLSRMRSYIDGVVPTKLSDLTDDVVAGNYLPLSGGTMTGRITWTGTSVIGNVEGGWNISGNQTGIQLLDDTVKANTGSPRRYSSGFHIGGYYAFQLAYDRTNMLWRGSPGSGSAWKTVYDSTNLTKSVVTTLLGDTYLPLSGGTMAGPLAWSGSTALPATTEASYFLAVDAFASGGQTKYITAANLAKSIASDVATEIGLSNYLSYYQYAVSGARNYYWVQINDTSSWSGSFTVKVYDGYHFEIYEIGGYNYTSSTGWYNARARLLLSSSRSSVSVVFGYTAAQELWFVIPTVTTGSGQPHRLMICDYNGTNLKEDVDFTCTTVTSMDAVEGTVQSTVTLTAYLSTATGVTIDTDQTISGTKTFSSGLLTISTATTGTPTLEFRRGAASDAYVDYKIVSNGGALQFVYGASGTDTVKAQFVTSAFRPAGTVTDNVSDMTLGNSDYYWGGVYSNSFIKKDGTSTQFLKADGSVDGTSYKHVNVVYDYRNGCLVRTKLSTTYNQYIYIVIEGRRHSNYPIFTQVVVQYSSSGSVFSADYSHAVRYGDDIGNITLFVYDGRIYFWFKQQNSYNTIHVSVYSATGKINYVDTITDEAIPEGATSNFVLTPTYTLLSTAGGTLSGNLTIERQAGASISLIAGTDKATNIDFIRGTTSDGYVDWRINGESAGLYFVSNENGTWTNRFAMSTSSLQPRGTVTNKVSDMTLGNSNYYWGGVYSSVGNFLSDLNVGGVYRSLTSPGGAGIIAKMLVYPTSPYGLVFRSSSNGTMSLQSQREADDTQTYNITLNPNGGNVGIGTEPSYKLHVGGTLGSSNAIYLIGATDATRRIYFGDTSHYLELNSNGFHFSHGVYSDSFVSAGGLNSSGGSGGGSTVTVIRAWSEYVATDTSQALGANLGYSLKSSIEDLDQDIYELDNRVTALEQGGGGGGTTTDPTLRMYPTTTNAWYSVLARYNNTSGSTYYTEYGRYTDNVQINPATGALLATSLSAYNSIDTQGTLSVGLGATIGGSLTVTGDSTFIGVTAFEDSITIDGVITLVDGQSSAEYQYPRYKLCASEAAYNAIVTKQSDVLYLIPES